MLTAAKAPAADTSFPRPGTPAAAAPDKPSAAPLKRAKREPSTLEPARPVRRATPRAAALRSGMTRSVPPPRDTSVPPVPPVPPRTLAAARTNIRTAVTEPKPAPVNRTRPAARPAAPGVRAAPGAPAPAPAPPKPTRAALGTRTAEDSVAVLVRELADAYRLVRLYEGKAAVELLCDAPDALPRRRAFRTAPVLCLLGRALHDLTEYAAAETHFRRARTLAPYLLMHMDMYSLVLFQLHREVALSALAQELLAIEPRAAVAHMAAGNTWSLQHQHDAAFQCFRQATLVAPECAYAYTLAGYEALELEQPARAVRLFRCARRCDRRHWNALAGLGQVYLRQGHAARACEAYAQAFLINRTNAVLLDLLGYSLEQAGDPEHALAVYDRAIAMQPKAAMTRLKKAQLLLRAADAEPDAPRTPQRRQAAHNELQHVCALAPAEARVHLLLARSYMRLGGGRFAARDGSGAPEDAAVLPQTFHAEITRHLAAAVDLDPRCVREVSAMGDVPALALPGHGVVIAEDDYDSMYADHAQDIDIDGTDVAWDPSQASW